MDGRVRFLKNVSGLWLLSESVRTWEQDGSAVDLEALLASAAEVTAPVPVFDVADESFTAPGDMPDRIAAWCSLHGLSAPATRPEFVRSILESLAAAYASTLRTIVEVTGKDVRAVHVVGGGSQNRPSASSPPTGPDCPSSPAPSRRPRSATCSSRRAVSASRGSGVHRWRHSATSSPAPSNPPATPRSGLGRPTPPHHRQEPRMTTTDDHHRVDPATGAPAASTGPASSARTRVARQIPKVRDLAPLLQFGSPHCRGGGSARVRADDLGPPHHRRPTHPRRPRSTTPRAPPKPRSRWRVLGRRSRTSSSPPPSSATCRRHTHVPCSVRRPRPVRHRPHRLHPHDADRG